MESWCFCVFQYFLLQQQVRMGGRWEAHTWPVGFCCCGSSAGLQQCASSGALQQPNCGKPNWSLQQPNPAGCVHFRPSCPVNAVLTKHPMEPDPRFSICTICFNFVCRRICVEQNFFEHPKKKKFLLRGFFNFRRPSSQHQSSSGVF